MNMILKGLIKKLEAFIDKNGGRVSEEMINDYLKENDISFKVELGPKSLTIKKL